MVLDARKRSILYAAMIARIFLASTLLLSAGTLIFEHGARTKLVSLVELFLGVVITVGWKTRYAAGLVLLGTLAMNLWVIPFRIAFTGSQAAVLGLIISSGFLICFGRNNAFRDHCSIGEKSRLSNSDLGAASSILSDPDVEVTIRLEMGFVQSLHKQRCIVTFHDLSGGARKTGKEVWYARDDQ
jgi:hypothetical protein